MRTLSLSFWKRRYKGSKMKNENHSEWPNFFISLAARDSLQFSLAIKQGSCFILRWDVNQMHYQVSDAFRLYLNQVSLPNPGTLSHKSSCIPRACNLWKVLPSCFPESYNLPSFKSIINKLDLISLYLT